MSIADLRSWYHQRLCQEIIRTGNHQLQGGYPNFADGSNNSSVTISWAIVNRLNCDPEIGRLSPQTIGNRFERLTRGFLEETFGQLHHLRPGKWLYTTDNTAIAGFEQYEHLARLKEIINQNDDLASALGGDYIVKPDIVIGRYAVEDDEINRNEVLVGDSAAAASLSPLRRSNREAGYPILHASISCKWTIRSDRSQNTRTEALNLIRNRKGRLPHIVAVTAEPLPTRLAALALGTGDMDCVYHFALPELTQALDDLGNVDQLDMLNTLVDGRRLRDISDLPLDLAV
jgi:hypothetical protein